MEFEFKINKTDLDVGLVDSDGNDIKIDNTRNDTEYMYFLGTTNQLFEFTIKFTEKAQIASELTVEEELSAEPNVEEETNDNLITGDVTGNESEFDLWKVIISGIVLGSAIVGVIIFRPKKLRRVKKH